jgi:transaldolase
MTNPLHRLTELGQAVWLDYIRRGILDDGSLARMIQNHALRGVTSNPTIFEQAIGGSDDYDAALEACAAEGLDASAAYERLAVEDIQRTADLFREVHESTGGADGFVSLEVSPELAHDTGGTLEEARRLWQAVDRPNLMIKVPGTAAGVPAVERLLSEGINVNVTLLFSLTAYERVMEAYLRALEARYAGGRSLDVNSVASFFVSRVDSTIDAQLDREAEGAQGQEAERLRELRGRAAVANAKLAYARFQEVFGSERFTRLREAGARVQRPLWASTSTKNPAYRDVIYVEELIGPDTVNTMPLATVEAFADHGIVRRTVDADLDAARDVLARLEGAGVSLREVTDQLEREGVEKFAESFRSLMETVAEKLRRVASG